MNVREAAASQQSKLPLTFACGLYDRMLRLYTGEVQPAGIDLEFLAIDEPREIFDRMGGGLEFDASEMSSSEFIGRFGAGRCPFVALPIFASRVFRHGFIFFNRNSGIQVPRDLEGKRVGVPLCESKDRALAQMKEGGALRYMLPWLPADMDEIDDVFGGDPWPYGIEAALASAASGQRGNSMVRAPDTRLEQGSSARAALASAASGQRGKSMVRAPDTRPEQGSSARANRPTLEALVRYMVEQHFIARPIPIEDLFVVGR